jgi:uncharacterized protein (TIGR02246 family)
VEAGNLDAVVGLYERDASLVQRDGSVATGQEAIRGVLGRLVAMRPAMRLHVIRVVRSGGDVAVLYNDWTMSAKTADGSPIEAAGKALEIVRRQADGTWRFVIDDPFARG